jgi:hypothetical protein
MNFLLYSNHSFVFYFSSFFSGFIHVHPCVSVVPNPVMVLSI